MTASPLAAGSCSPLRQLLDRWFGVDIRALALVRIGIGLLLLGDLWTRAQSLDAHYTDAGVLPTALRHALTSDIGASRWVCVHLLSGERWFQQALFGVAAVAAALVTIGYRTWPALLVSHWLLVSLHARHPLLLQGGDVLLRCLTFWSLFLPLGACWSLDARHGIGPPPQRVRSIASAALLLQLAGMYWFTAILKTAPDWHTTYDAAYYALSYHHFTSPLGYWCLQFPTALRLLTASTWWLEVLGPLLAFVPLAVGSDRLRVLAILMFVSMHVSLGLCMDLGYFPPICMVYWLAFLPTSVLDRWFARVHDRQETPAPAWWTLPLVQSFAGLMAFYALWINVARLHVPAYAEVVHGPLAEIGKATGVDQHWPMFAPGAPKLGWWWIIKGYQKDGTEVNLWQPTADLSEDRPPLLARVYPNVYWRRHMLALLENGEEPVREGTARYFQQRWNASCLPGQEVTAVEIVACIQYTSPPEVAEPAPVTSILLYPTPQTRLLASAPQSSAARELAQINH